MAGERRLNSSYELTALLGSGMTGTVWQAHRSHPVAQTVAVKRLRYGNPAEVGRLRREATMLATLDHPNIVRVLEVIDDGADVALVLQHAAGGSLAHRLASRTRLTPAEVVAFAVPIASALESAHRRGIVHGDVKPANVLFTSGGEPLLGDFGIARVIGREATIDEISGTAEYLAPELLEGATPDPRSDVYSLGVVCYQALAGVAPFVGTNPLAIVRAADRGDHVPLTVRADVPPPLAAVVEQAIARDPARRPQTAEEFAAALRTSLAPAPTETRTFGPRPAAVAAPTAPRRHGWALLATVWLAAVAAIAVAVVLGIQDDGDGQQTAHRKDRREQPAPKPKPKPAPTPTPPAPPTGEDPTIEEQGFSFVNPHDDGTTGATFGLTFKNPNRDVAIGYASVGISFLAADGRVLGETSSYLGLVLPGETAAVGGYMLSLPNGAVTMKASVSDTRFEAVDDLRGTLSASGVEFGFDQYGGSETSGFISNPFTVPAEDVRLAILYRDAANTIVGGDIDYPDTVPAQGQVGFLLEAGSAPPTTTTINVVANLDSSLLDAAA